MSPQDGHRLLHGALKGLYLVGALSRLRALLEDDRFPREELSGRLLLELRKALPLPQLVY